MQKIETNLSGCFVIQPQVFGDHRGRLVKTFHHETFRELNLEVEYSESYYSVSNKGVLRGLHFQRPPHSQVKLVTCVSGKLLDVVVDVRLHSSTYGQYFAIELSPQNASMLYIPEGFAHGFYAMEDNTILQYFGSAMFHSKSDGGIRWDSCGIEWPDMSPILSVKDQNMPSLEEFDSPFKLEAV